MPAKVKGRPREFVEGDAIEAAMLVFWRHGYDGASTSELTSAMGINRSSFYATFSDKESLYRRALERYAAGPAGYIGEATKLPSAREVVHALLDGVVALHSNLDNPLGCMSVQGALVTCPASTAVREVTADFRRAAEQLLVERFRQAQTNGDLPNELRPEHLAKYLATVLSGISVQAANGASGSELRQVADMAIQALPFALR